MTSNMDTMTDLARRFLHVNLNTVNASASHAFYEGALGLTLKMKTDPTVPSPGEILGFDRDVRCDTRFFYDSRGGRVASAVEVIEWLDPKTQVSTRAHPATPGLHALGFSVPDLAAQTRRLEELGYRIISRDALGLISGTISTVVTDPDGVSAEISQHDADVEDGAGIHFAGVRVTCSDLDASLQFYRSIGFGVVGEPETKTIDVRSAGLDEDGTAEVRVCPIAMAEDGSKCGMTLVEWRSPAGSIDNVYAAPNRQGLYRCALRVENTSASTALARDNGVVVRGPIWCPMPGTPIGGLEIAFITDPDGVVLEFVERPLSNFTVRGK